MTISRFRRFAVSSLLMCALLVATAPASAQVVAERGFVEGTAWLFPQTTPNDSTRLLGDLLVRNELFVKPARWIQFAAGIDLRANSHDQVDTRWRVDFTDRDPLRPAIAVRRLSASLSHGPLTVDVGKQFIRWGKTDIVTPTDRFAPRDFLNVIDNEFLAVTGARAVVQFGSNSVDAIWVPFFTPSRTPLVDQRWTAVPASAAGVRIVDSGSEIPRGSEVGLRFAHTASAIEYAFSVFDGFNHLPNLDAAAAFSPQAGGPVCSTCGELTVDIRRVYPSLRTYGADVALPTKWLTIKGETAYFQSSSASSDEYILYVRASGAADGRMARRRRLCGRSRDASPGASHLCARSRHDAVVRGPRVVHHRYEPIAGIRNRRSPDRRWFLRTWRVLAGSWRALADDHRRGSNRRALG